MMLVKTLKHSVFRSGYNVWRDETIDKKTIICNFSDNWLVVQIILKKNSLFPVLYQRIFGFWTIGLTKQDVTLNSGILD